jgi:ribosomal protein S21
MKGECDMAEVKRKKGETFDALFRRFQRRIQSSGKVLQAKKIRFHKKDENPNKRREGALRREEMRSKYAYELKTGKLKPDPKKRGRF